ncbi:Holliday junction resolvase RuvX [Sporocytophaga myxococcoides]|uniref:Holliday junction resolvase RuvX n=1 Tax=Sporocytophaga myxococcoides TaxID=153721 RepID=UPI0005ED575A|nr:Holliday junction resolvase RuvX [Sporocytophaga myxococcoides]
MGRILAIDYGRKRVGLAVTDPLKIIATALDTIDESKVLDFLKAYCSKEDVEAFVVGMPKTLDNNDSENAKYVKAFSEKLIKMLPSIPIHFIDERFTSSMALNAMIAGGMKKKDRREKGNIDKISATIILQSFLEQQRR